MGQTKVTERNARPAWPTALLVVALVAAASVALGLTVVGPMIQRSRETPPPTLALNTPAPEPSIEAPRAEAEVQIKERVIPRPKPKPPAELVVPLTLAGQDAALPGTADSAPGDVATRPANRATDGDNERAGKEDRPHAAIRGDVTEAGDDDGEAGDGSRNREGDSKSRRRRLSPLEALPALGSSLPRSPASDQELGAGAAGTDATSKRGSAETGREGGARRNGRSYRVQVGRFTDESDARRLRDELEGSGLSPRIVKTERDGVVLFRVQVGTFKMEENAKRQVEQLKEKQYEPYIADDDP